MNSQAERAAAFTALHIKGNPLILFNIWDAGSAQAVQEAGAKALATGSWAVAAAHGYADRQELPLELALANLQRIVASVTLPVTLDFEGGYGESPAELHANVAQAIQAGAVGVNFEDQFVGGEGLHSVDEQSARIRAIRAAANQASIPLFINARTDLFLKTEPANHTEDLLQDALRRAGAYAEAGASGFFALGLRDPGLIGKLCERAPLPVNIMVMQDTPPPKTLAELGVARISYAGGPYRLAMAALREGGRKAFALE